MNEPLDCVKHLYYLQTPDDIKAQMGAVDQKGGKHHIAPAPPQKKKAFNLDRTRNDYYGEKAFTYDSNRENDPKWKAEMDAVKSICTTLRGHALDIPCGTGRMFPFFIEEGMTFVGMDVSEDMMAIAKGKGKYDVRPGDILNIPADDNEYDHSFCIRLLEKMTEDEMHKAILELGRVSKQTITVCLITGEQQQERNRSYVHRESRFLDAVREAGFSPTKKFPIREPEMWVWHCEAN